MPHAWLDEEISQKHCRAQFNLLKAEFETLILLPQVKGQAQPGGQAAAPAPMPEAQLAHDIIDQHQAGAGATALDWPAVYTLHRCILALLPEDDLRRAAWALRERYREMFGEREYANYMASKPPELTAGSQFSAKAVLADLDTLLELIYSNHAMGPDNSWLLRRRVVATMITIGIGLTIMGLLLAFAFDGHFAGATLLTVGIVGSMGGFVSVLQRLRQLGGTGDALTDYHEIQSVRYTTIFASGVIGALFAGVLYLLFAGGLIEGQLFPRFAPATVQAAGGREAASKPATQPQTPPAESAPSVQPAGQAPPPDTAAAKPQSGAPSASNAAPAATRTAPLATPAKPAGASQAAGAAQTPAQERNPAGAATPSVFTFLEERHPQGQADVALLVLWAFLAGFFERFVPDQLNRLLAKKAEQQG